MRINEKNGITLIALVVTIVVLLILAGITINLILGDNGIFAKARTAKENWEGAEVEEIEQLSNLDEKVNDILNNKKTFTITLGDKEYTVEEGMTWAEWCNSTYSADEFGYDDYWVYRKSDHMYIAGYDYVGKNDIIIDTNYSFGECFIAGTKVQCNLNGETKNIEKFKAGDTVISYDIFSGKYYEAQVRELVIHDGVEKARILADITLEDGSILTLTPNHPIYTENGFKAISNKKYEELNIGNLAQTSEGLKKITSIKIYECKPTVVYNLKIRDYDEVIDDDTYDTYIANGVIVHNLK